MSEEPTLPRFPAVSWNSETQSFDNTRKRARNGSQDYTPQLLANSSDPAMFSSDDDPNLENYTQGKRHRKKRYVGSWFQQHPASGDSAFSEETRDSKPGSKRTFKRTIDSGIWMGSDCSTDLELEEPLPSAPASRLPQLNVSRYSTNLSEAEELARDRIFHAVDNGEEDIDLTSMNLGRLSNATIAPLSELTLIPTVTPGVPFEQKDPSLKIYLSQNPLTQVPGAIFSLEFLTYLSLRNTKLTEIPPALGQLRNLETLNISLNRIRYLPGELLQLLKYPSKLKHIMLQPNPFHQPVDDYELLPQPEESEYDESQDHLVLGHKCFDGSVMRLWLDQRDTVEKQEYPQIHEDEPRFWRARIHSRTPVQYEDIRSSRSSSFFSEAKLPAEELTQLPSTPLTTRTSSAPIRQASRVPSLMELALKSCSRTSQLPVLPSYLPDNVPTHLPKLLSRIVGQAEANANAGDLPCSECGRRIIVPVAKWIEWWDLRRLKAQSQRGNSSSIVSSTGIVPFMKQACSYGCLPKPCVPGALLSGTLRFNVERGPEP